jgi:hypothetical protein
MTAPLRDDPLKKKLGRLGRIPAPQSAVDGLFTAIRERKPESSRAPGPVFSLLFSARRVVAAVAVTLAVSVPVTYFLAVRQFRQPEVKSFVVRFVYENPSASMVRVVGDFNNWSRSGVSLQRVAGTGYWTGEIVLREGIYKYVFLIDDSEFAPDPFSAIKVRDDFGNESSLIVLLGNPEGRIQL